MCEVVFKRTLSPWLRPDFLFFLSRYGRNQLKALKILHGFSRGVVEKKVESRKAAGGKKDTKEDLENNDLGKFLVYLELVHDRNAGIMYFISGVVVRALAS